MQLKLIRNSFALSSERPPQQCLNAFRPHVVALLFDACKPDRNALKEVGCIFNTFRAHYTMPSQRPSINARRKAGPTPKGSGSTSTHGATPLRPASIAQEIGRRIDKASKANPARVHTPFDFLDLGSPHSVGMALMRLVRSGGLRRLARGLYDVPRQHPLLGELQPTADEIAQALSRRDGALVQPAQAMAANLLNLSEQIPARAVYETDGPSRTVRVGSLTVQLKHRPSRQVRSASPMSNLVFAALRSVGKDNVNEARVAHLRETLSAKDRATLLKDLPQAPAWMHPYLRFITAPTQRSAPASKAAKRRKQAT